MQLHSTTLHLPTKAPEHQVYLILRSRLRKARRSESSEEPEVVRVHL